MRLIDADIFNNFDYSSFFGALTEDAVQGMETVLTAIDTAPTIDAVPMRHGHWEFKDDFGNRNYDFVAVCSRCGKEEKASGYSHSEWISEWQYCNSCGAQLDEVDK